MTLEARGKIAVPAELQHLHCEHFRPYCLQQHSFQVLASTSRQMAESSYALTSNTDMGMFTHSKAECSDTDVGIM